MNLNRRNFLKLSALAGLFAVLPKTTLGQVESAVQKPMVRTLKATYTTELAQDLRYYHGLDAEEELTKILAEEISREIDKEITGTIYTRNVMDKASFCRHKELTFVQDGRHDYKTVWGLKGNL